MRITGQMRESEKGDESVKTIVRKTDQISPSKEDIGVAANVIREGGTVVFPTETVYGLGASAFDSDACRKIFEIKRRPVDNPLIVHVDNLATAFNLVDLESIDYRIIEKIWPGPITLVVNSRAVVPDIVTGGLETIAIRMPANPLALEFIKKAKVPIAAPSANRSTRPSIVDSREAIEELDGFVDFIFDSGRTFFGMESTIIDARPEIPKVLRPGAFTAEDIMSIFGRVSVDAGARALQEQDHLVSPGMKYTHYSPDIPMYLLEDIDEYIDYCNNRRESDFIAIVSDGISKYIKCEKITMGDEDKPYEIARDLFPVFRRAEKTGKNFAVIHSVREIGIGLAIMNRIRKASVKGKPPENHPEEQ